MAEAEGGTEGPPERRRKSRKRSLLGAIVIYADGKFSFDCTIRSLSETGARIAISKTAQLPTRFYLINIRDGVIYDATLCWHNGEEAGVEFAGAMDLPDSSDPKLGFLKRAWLERAPR